jgi:hypothetical protein
MAQTYKIEIACDGIEGEEFAAWLRSKGHDAFVGRSTAGYVDGEWTSHNDDAKEIMNRLWNDYCNA